MAFARYIIKNAPFSMATERIAHCVGVEPLLCCTDFADTCYAHADVHSLTTFGNFEILLCRNFMNTGHEIHSLYYSKRTYCRGLKATSLFFACSTKNPFKMTQNSY